AAAAQTAPILRAGLPLGSRRAMGSQWVLALASALLAARAAAVIATREAARAEDAFQKSCGGACAQAFEALAGASPAVAPTAVDVNDALVALATQSLLQARRATQHAGLKLAASRRASGSSPSPGSDTACATPARCRLKEAMANRCNYGREALQATYEGVNAAAHVMGSLISSLCGCIFVRG
ncbi:unnamed protein product, partial [Prorocentrum cordatum]